MLGRRCAMPRQTAPVLVGNRRFRHAPTPAPAPIDRPFAVNDEGNSQAFHPSPTGRSGCAASRARAPAAASRSRARDRPCGQARHAHGRPLRRWHGGAPDAGSVAPAPDTGPQQTDCPRGPRVRSRSTGRCSCRSRASSNGRHARRAGRQSTYCSTRPLRRITKWADTSSPRSACEARIGLRIEPVGEQPLDRIAAVDARWQADRVQHDERRLDTDRARPVIGRLDAARAAPPAAVPGRAQHARRRPQPRPPASGEASGSGPVPSPPICSRAIR